MFDSLKDSLKKANEERAKLREEELRKQKSRERQRETEERIAEDRERKIQSVRVITGDVRYRYAILDTLRVFAHYIAEPGEAYDPTAATQQATRQMQELAFAAGADAVIHAQYQILRYTATRRNYADVPVYEAHLFGTAIKIMGPPSDWDDEAGAS
jgi:uncharacterized protein YbjQ (UPF0145 family)